MTIAERQKPAAGELYLDHVAHFVPDLGAAGRLAEALGFSVTPVSAHRDQNGPAGTSNRCLVFEQGYVEILAPTLDMPNARRVRERVQSFVGVHLACLGTPDAAAEHGRLAAHGFEPKPLVRLQRNVDEQTIVRFNVVYVPPAKMPEGRIQYVEQLTPENLWQQRYVNPLRLTGVYVVSDDPVQTAARWGRFAGLMPRRDGKLVVLDCARGSIFISTRKYLSALLGDAPPAPALAGYSLACRDAEALAARCAANGLEVRRREDFHSVLLPPALGGAWLFG
jgi:hypothetical protein